MSQTSIDTGSVEEAERVCGILAKCFAEDSEEDFEVTRVDDRVWIKGPQSWKDFELGSEVMRHLTEVVTNALDEWKGCMGAATALKVVVAGWKWECAECSFSFLASTKPFDNIQNPQICPWCGDARGKGEGWMRYVWWAVPD